MQTLFFDLARRSGYAAGAHHRVEKFGFFEMPATGEDVGTYLIFAERQIDTLIGRHHPKLLGYEAPLLVSRRKIGNKWVNVDTPKKLQKLYGLANEVEKAAIRHGIPCVYATLGQIRTHFLGAGYPNDTDRVKIAVKNKCRALGWDVPESDEADALAGLSYLLSLQRPDTAVAVTPLFQSRASRARGKKIARG
jgi:hypothetical protein